MLFKPNDVVSQRRDLLRRQGHANCEVEFILARDGVVHQVLELILIGGLPIDEGLAGTSDHSLLYQSLFVEPVTEALGAGIGVVAKACEQVVRVHELFEVGECGVGFDQVLWRLDRRHAVGEALHAHDVADGRTRGVLGVESEQTVLTRRQAETRQCSWVNLQLCQVRRQLAVEQDG